MPTREGARFGSLVSLFQIALLFSACFTIASCATSNGANGQAATQNVNAVPVLSSLSATSVIAGTQGLTITVNGNGFVQGSIVEFNGSTRTTSYVSATQLQATLTSADVAVGGTDQIVVVSPAPGGGTSAPMSFTVNNPSPQLSSISPSTVMVGSVGSIVTLTGTGFVSNSTVTWNGTAHAASYMSGTQLQITLLTADVAATGTAQISVVNPAPQGGSATTLPMAITNSGPVISSLIPSSVSAGSGPILLTVTGTGFTLPSIVQINGASRTTTNLGPNTLRTQLTPIDTASAGTLQVTVTGVAPGSVISAPATFTITVPVLAITSLSPNAITQNSPDTVVTVTGTAFSASSTVQINGGPAITPTSITSTQLTFTVPASYLTSLGTLSITVSNPNAPPSNALLITVRVNPVPAITSITPNSAPVGSGAVTLSLSGSNFVSNSVVLWNGSPRPTVFVSSNQITASISAIDIDGLGNNSITVSNPAPSGGLSGIASFTTFVNVPAADLVYSQATQLLYASLPSNAGPILGNSVVSIDPFTGALGAPIYVGSEPGKMAISSDGGTVWVALNGAGAMRQVNLNTSTAGLQFSLGGGRGIYNPPNTAQALAILPGHPDTVAVAATSQFSDVITIYDGGVPRTNTVSASFMCCGLSFDPTGTKLYGAGSGYGVATVDGSGLSAATLLNQNVSTNGLRIDNGRAYLTNGAVLNANSGTLLGMLSINSTTSASGPVAPDSVIGEAFVLQAPTFGSGYQFYVYDLSSFALKSTFPVSVASGDTNLMRWGQDGLAFTTGGVVFALRSTSVQDLSSSLADLSVSTSAAATGIFGNSFTYGLTVQNAGPLAATAAVLSDSIPSGAIIQSVTTSQGTCSGGAVVLCDLGNLNSAASANVQISVILSAPGILTNTAFVSAPQGDPNFANNTSVTSATVTGSLYNPAPSLISISPAFTQAGSPSFTITVNGSNFVAGTVVQLNSTPLPTSFVSVSKLTATVDATYVSSMGWSWINVTSPLPGGGTSSSSPLTTYKVISLDVNRMVFDAFTRKLYATLPSTATQAAGNSLVSIDPIAGVLGMPINIGSEPHVIAESNDGKYLYVGLNGSQSLTRFDLNSSTQGPVYPLLFPNGGSTVQVAPRDLAVSPGSDDVLAVDANYGGPIGIFDISGSTGTMRPTLAQGYPGTNLAFASDNLLYSFDTDTSAAEFYRWDVSGSGLTLDNNTGYTLNSIGGYKFVDGIVYGFGGGVADPSTTPPTQLGRFTIGSAQGTGQDIEGFGVAPDPAIGRVFFLGETLAGTANPVLLSYDSSRYVLLNMQQFTGAIQGEDLVRWGRDGLAWHTNMGGAFGNSTPGAGQIILMRGPFVLPEWSTVNPIPVPTSVSPSAATTGSGNLTLTVAGSGFVPGAVVLWNGAERTTTLVDVAHLKVAVPASDLLQSGTATLVVNNPGSANSVPVLFTIN